MTISRRNEFFCIGKYPQSHHLQSILTSKNSFLHFFSFPLYQSELRKLGFPCCCMELTSSSILYFFQLLTEMLMSFYHLIFNKTIRHLYRILCKLCFLFFVSNRILCLLPLIFVINKGFLDFMINLFYRQFFDFFRVKNFCHRCFRTITTML